MIMKAKTRNWTPKFIALAIVCLLVGAGIGLVSYHYFLKPQSAVYEALTQGNTSTNWQSTKVEPTKEMVEEIVLLGNGKKEPIDPKSEEGIGIASLLTRKLHELNLQAKCAFSKEEIQEIEQKDRSIRLFFKKPIDITISQWVEPEERYHIPVDEKGYRILEDVETALFILKDNLDEGLEGHILVGSERKDRDERCSWKVTEKDKENYKELGPIWSMSAGYEFDEERGCTPVGGSKYIPEIVPFKTKEECEMACGRIMWGCWVIQQKDINELDKNWIEGINRILAEMKSKEIATKDKIIVGIEAGPIAIECFNKSYLIETSDYIIDGTVEKVDEKADMEKGIYSYVYLTIDGYFKGKPLLVKEKVADMLQINVSVRAPYNFTSYEGKKVRIYLRKWSEGDFRIFCGNYGVEEIWNHSEYTIIKKSLGPVKGDFVHYIPLGSIIYHSNDDITTVYTPEGKVILKAKDSEAAKLPVPGPTDYLPATHVYQVPSGSSGSTEPFEFQTEDRGLISTKEAKMTYKNGEVVLVVIEEKSIKDAIIQLFNPRAWMEKLERLFDGIYGWWRTS